jgi:S1-C subfamily serine protease
MKRRIFLQCGSAALAGAVLATTPYAAAALPDTVARIKPSVVGVGTYVQTRSPAIAFAGTGFVVGDGLSVITNAHVVPDAADGARKEALGVVVGNAAAVQFRAATLVALDREHDLAHLRLEGTPLPALALSERDDAREGQALAFTGFPLGMVLGLYPATHRALLAAITPVVRPALSARGLDARAIAQLQRAAFTVYQLDGTAYPGNSGSPVFDPDTGTVLAVVNMVFVKGLKETAITNPSGITYAVPVSHVRALLQRHSPP